MATKQTIQEPRQFEATARGFRQSPQKARLVMDLVRGKNAKEALTLLKFTPNRAAREIINVLRSAMANAEDHSNRENLGLDAETLILVEARVDQGIRTRRWRSRSRGMAAPILRRYCHFHVKLARAEDMAALKIYRTVKSQKRRVDRMKDLPAGMIAAAKPAEHAHDHKHDHAHAHDHDHKHEGEHKHAVEHKHEGEAKPKAKGKKKE